MENIQNTTQDTSNMSEEDTEDQDLISLNDINPKDQEESNKNSDQEFEDNDDKDGDKSQGEEADGDMMSMFASVWVKVEVDEGNSDADKKSPVQKPAKKKRVYRKSSKILCCDLCDYTTIYKNCLVLHIIGHTNSRPNACQYCEYTTKYPTSLARHILIRHQSTDMPEEQRSLLVYRCDQCEYSSYFKWNLNAHKRKHKLEKQFKCPHCEYSTAYRHNFLKHSKVHSEGVFFKCDKCPFVTKFEGHITRHLAKIHNEVTEKAFKCELCDFSTKVRWRLNIHRQRSRQEQYLKCDFCNHETLYMCEHKAHKVVHYNKIYGTSLNQDIPHPPNYESFNSKPIDAPMDEDDADKSQNQYTLEPGCVDWNSIQVLESDDKEKPFLCHMCSYTSKFKAAVQRHYQRHHTGSQNRPYKCNNCDFSTKTKDQIALHNKRSKTDKVLVCKTCGFMTKYKCQNVMHQKTHYAYKCTSCSYSCRQKYELQKHYTTLHLGNGLKCQYCDYKAARKESLLCHETIHTGNKPYKCTLCPYMSVRRCLLDNHIKRYHSEIKKDITTISDDKIDSLKIMVPKFEGFAQTERDSIIDSIKNKYMQT